MLRLTLRQLHIFVAVARTGSTTVASTELALSQSATSSAVNELERLLAFRFFDRSGKRLVLNDNGRALLPLAQGLLARAAEVERMTDAPHVQLQKLRIGASTTIGDHALPSLLARLLKNEPACAPSWQSSVTIGNTASICGKVGGFELDIGLIEGPCHDSNLKATPWLTDELVVVGAPAQVKSFVVKAPRSVLRESTWLLRESGSGTREVTDQTLLKYLPAYRRSIELGSNEAIKHAAVAGLGIACLSRWVVRDMLQTGRLCELATTLPKIKRQWYWIVHRDKQPSPSLSRLIMLLSTNPS